jgi:hypothetical protein
VGQNSVIYMGLILGPNKTDKICGKTMVTGTMHRGSTVVITISSQMCVLKYVGKFGHFSTFIWYIPYCLLCAFMASLLNTVTFPGERVCDRSSDCSHYCHDAPMGSVCYCPSHLHLQPDKMTCLDSHPCEAWGVCSQLCQPLKYGHKCLCEEGYELQHDGFTCKSTGNFPLTDCRYL